MNKQAILKQAKERYSEASAYWAEFNATSKIVLNFVVGDQWDSQVRSNRQSAGLPVLSSPRLGGFLRAITNEVRQNTPSIQIDPQNDEAAVETGEILSDLCRSIEQDSRAETAYDQATWYAAATGLGFARIISEYVDVDSFEQKLKVMALEDPSTVLMDPHQRAADGSDQEYCFIVTEMSKAEFELRFPTAKYATEGWTSDFTDWVEEDSVLVAEYYYKDYEQKTLLRLFNQVDGSYLNTFNPDYDEAMFQKIDSRQVDVPVIKWAKLTDNEVLESTSWPGTYIPVVPFKGEEIWINGKRSVKGAVYDAMDSQRLLNYNYSVQAELVQLAPKAPYLGTIEQFAGFEQLYRDANVSNPALLPYNYVAGVEAPHRDVQEVPIQAAASMCAQAVDSMKAIFGVYDASQGANGNETSGVAILARVNQANNTNYHFQDNARKSIAQLGRILVEAIPEFYKEENRLLQLTKANGDRRPMVVNDGQVDLSKGKWAVTIQAGPSFATKRQAALAGIAALGQVYPEAMPSIADLLAENSDWPQSRILAKRLKAMVPPNILAATEDVSQGDAQAMVPQLKQQVQVQGEQLKAAEQATTDLHKENDYLKQEVSLSKMDRTIEMTKAELDYKVKTRQMDLSEAETQMEYQIKQVELQIAQANLALKQKQMELAAIGQMSDMAHRDLEVHEGRAAKVDLTPGPSIPYPEVDMGNEMNNSLDRVL